MDWTHGAATEIVQLKDVCKSYRRGKDAIEVLKGLNLSVLRGDFLCLMGPSGSGKTTLLNLIAGLDHPTSGEIIVAGELLNELSGRKLAHWRAQHVGFIFQLYNLIPVLTAAQNVEVPLLLTNLSRSQRQDRVHMILELVGLRHRAKHRPSELSGGEQQRVAVARAIVSDPTILVCDEPTGDLDRKTADEIMELLQMLNRTQGKTIIMVTHDPKAAQYATHPVQIDKGRLTMTRAAVSENVIWAISFDTPTLARQSGTANCSFVRRAYGRLVDQSARRGFDLYPARLMGDNVYGSAEMLGWLVYQYGIEPHVTVFDKSARQDGTFSRENFTCD